MLTRRVSKVLSKLWYMYKMIFYMTALLFCLVGGLFGPASIVTALVVVMVFTLPWYLTVALCLTVVPLLLGFAVVVGEKGFQAADRFADRMEL